MKNVLDFSKLRNRYTFEIKLRMITPLHIGGEQAEAITSDNPILKDSNGVPFIPGSSLKGILRSASERTVHLLNKHTCFLVKGECEPQKTNINKLAEDGKEEEYYQALYERLCPVCRTYGGGTISSKVRIQHTFFDSNTKTLMRTSNKIDRETGTAADGALFSYEYIKPGSEFNIVIEAENMDKENLEVLGLALAQIYQNSVRLGGMQAKGLGQIEYVKGTVREELFEENNKRVALENLLGLSNVQNRDLVDFLKQLLLKGE